MDKNQMPTNMTRRGAVYYARVGIPKEYQALLVRKEIMKSLGTKDFKKARQKLPQTLLG